IDHDVDGVLQLQNFAFDVHRDLAREIAASHGRGDVRDIADLTGEVGRHRVDGVGEVFPGAGDTRHRRAAAELAFGTDFAGDAEYFRREGVQLIDHRVDGVLQFQNFTFHIDRDLARQIAAGDGCGYTGDVAHLSGQVSGHGVDRVGE